MVSERHTWTYIGDCTLGVSGECGVKWRWDEEKIVRINGQSLYYIVASEAFTVYKYTWWRSAQKPRQRACTHARTHSHIHTQTHTFPHQQQKQNQQHWFPLSKLVSPPIPLPNPPHPPLANTAAPMMGIHSGRVSWRLLSQHLNPTRDPGQTRGANQPPVIIPFTKKKHYNTLRYYWAHFGLRYNYNTTTTTTETTATICVVATTLSQPASPRNRKPLCREKEKQIQRPIWWVQGRGRQGWMDPWWQHAALREGGRKRRRNGGWNRWR